MKKNLVIFISLMIIILFSISIKVFQRNSANTYNINGTKFTKQEIMKKCFHINSLDSSYIKEFNVEQDGDDSDIPKSYFVDVKLVIPEKEISELFSYYKNNQKMVCDDEELKMQLYMERGINKSNFSYYYIEFGDAEKGGWATQRTTYVIFTKPVNGAISVFLTQDKLGWD